MCPPTWVETLKSFQRKEEADAWSRGLVQVPGHTELRFSSTHCSVAELGSCLLTHHWVTWLGLLSWSHPWVTELTLSRGLPLSGWVRTPLLAPHWVAGFRSFPYWSSYCSPCDLECQDVVFHVSSSASCRYSKIWVPHPYLPSGSGRHLLCLDGLAPSMMLWEGQSELDAHPQRIVFDWKFHFSSKRSKIQTQSLAKQPWVKGLSYLFQPTDLIYE